MFSSSKTQSPRPGEKLAGLLFQPWNNEFSTFRVVAARPLVTPGPSWFNDRKLRDRRKFLARCPVTGAKFIKGSTGPHCEPYLVIKIFLSEGRALIMITGACVYARAVPQCRRNRGNRYAIAVISRASDFYFLLVVINWLSSLRFFSSVSFKQFQSSLK